MARKSIKASACINCGVVPVTRKQTGYYKFVLSHPENSMCASDFRLEAHHHTRQKCIDNWNEFNVVKYKKYV